MEANKLKLYCVPLLAREPFRVSVPIKKMVGALCIQPFLFSSAFRSAQSPPTEKIFFYPQIPDHCGCQIVCNPLWERIVSNDQRCIFGVRSGYAVGYVP